MDSLNIVGNFVQTLMQVKLNRTDLEDKFHSVSIHVQFFNSYDRVKHFS